MDSALQRKDGASLANWINAKNKPRVDTPQDKQKQVDQDQPIENPQRKAREALLEIASNTEKKDKFIVRNLAESIPAFRDSALADIDKLLAQGHENNAQSILETKGELPTDSVLIDAKANVRVLQGVIDILEQRSNATITLKSGETVSMQSHIESIKTLKKAVQDAIDGYNYRERENLPSGTKQIEDHLDAVANGKDVQPFVIKTENGRQVAYENPAFDEQQRRFTNQPDIAAEFRDIQREKIAIEKIFNEKGINRPDGTQASVVGLLQFVDATTKDATAETWDQQRENVTRAAAALRDMSELTVFGEVAKNRLSALADKIQATVLDQVFEDKNITNENGAPANVQEFLSFVERAATDNEAATWSEKDCADVLRYVQTLQEMKNLPVFDVIAEEALEVLTSNIQSQMEEASGLDRVGELKTEYQQEVVPNIDPWMETFVAEVNGVLFSEDARNHRGWVQIDGDTAKRLDALATQGIEKYGKKRLVDRLGIPNAAAERIILDKKADFCKHIRGLITKLNDTSGQMQVMRPILAETSVMATYLQEANDEAYAEQMAKVNSELDEEKQQRRVEEAELDKLIAARERRKAKKDGANTT